MTAAEYRRSYRETLKSGSELHSQVLAALEEREALLEQAKFGSADASVGALVRRIGELQPSAYLTWAGHPMCYYVKHPSVLQSALDSLLPKEPEVAPLRWTDPAPSGKQYRVENGVVWAQWANHAPWEAEWRCSDVSVEDAPVVAKLMESAKEVGK